VIARKKSLCSQLQQERERRQPAARAQARVQYQMTGNCSKTTKGQSGMQRGQTRPSRGAGSKQRTRRVHPLLEPSKRSLTRGWPNSGRCLPPHWPRRPG